MSDYPCPTNQLAAALDRYIIPAVFDYEQGLREACEAFGYEAPVEFDPAANSEYQQELQLVICRLHEVADADAAAFLSQTRRGVPVSCYTPAAIKEAQKNLPCLLAGIQDYLIEAEVLDNTMSLVDVLSHEGILRAAPRSLDEVLHDCGLFEDAA